MAAQQKRKALELGLKHEAGWMPKVTSAFSLPAIHRVFSGMCGERFEILQSLGLHGLTKIRSDTKENRLLALWLLRNMDPDSGAIMFGNGVTKRMTNADVQLILGFNPGSKKISLPICDTEILHRASDLLFLEPGETITLQHLEYLLTCGYGECMVQQERAAFAVAAVLFAEAHFLAPKGRQPKVNKELLQLLCTEPGVEAWDWSAYVLDALKSSSITVQQSLQRSNKTCTLDGCLLLIQIFYLDNLDFGLMMLPYISIPRVVDFTTERLKVYADADSMGDNTFGRTKLKKRSELVYWNGRNIGCQVPVRSINFNNFFRGSIVDFITTIIGDNKGSSGESMDRLSQHLSHMNKLIGDWPDYDLSSNSSNDWTRSGIDELSAGGSNSPDPDLSGPDLIINPDFCIVVKEVCVHSEFISSPFEGPDSTPMAASSKGNQNHVALMCLVEAMYGRLAAMDDEDVKKFWYLHDVPNILTLDGRTLRKQFLQGADLDWKFMDAAIRMLANLEHKTYPTTSTERWRHFLPSSWAIDAIRAGELIQSEDVRDMFIGDHITYNIENCRLIIAPVLLAKQWHCYVWDFKEEKITVMDPSRMGCHEAEIEGAHSKTVDRLHDELFNCKNTFFRGWNVSRNSWSRKYLTVDGAGGPMSMSGVYTLHYALYFGGGGLMNKLTSAGAVVFAKQLLYHVLTMEGNMGHVPTIRKRAPTRSG